MPGDEAGPQKQLRNDYEVGTEPASGLLCFIPTCKAKAGTTRRQRKEGEETTDVLIRLVLRTKGVESAMKRKKKKKNRRQEKEQEKRPEGKSSCVFSLLCLFL